MLPLPVVLLPSCWAQKGAMPGFGEMPPAVSLLRALERCSACWGQWGAKVSGRTWVQHMHPSSSGEFQVLLHVSCSAVGWLLDGSLQLLS